MVTLIAPMNGPRADWPENRTGEEALPVAVANAIASPATARRDRKTRRGGSVVRAAPRRTPVSRFHPDGTMRGPASWRFGVVGGGPSTAAGNGADRYPEVWSPTAGRSMARGEGSMGAAMKTDATDGASRVTRAGRSAVSAGHPILASKITAPGVPEWAVHRRRITKLIVQGTRWCPLTVVTGPPGAGKTMALALWTAIEPGMVAWICLDQYDNRPEMFWSYVLAALRASGVAVPGVAAGPGWRLCLSAAARGGAGCAGSAGDAGPG